MSKTPQRGFTLRRVSYRSAYNGITQRVLVWGTTYSRMNVAEITYYPKPFDWMNGCRWAADMTYSGGSGATFATLGEAREYCERRFVDEVLKYRKEGR